MDNDLQKPPWAVVKYPITIKIILRVLLPCCVNIHAARELLSKGLISIHITKW